MRYYEKIVYLIIGILILSLLFWYFLKMIVLPPDGAIVIYHWRVSDTQGRTYALEEHFAPKVLSKDVPPGVFTYTSTVEPLKSHRTDYAIVISHTSFQAFRVYIDDKLIGWVGDMHSGRSNIWNGVFYFPIDKTMVLDKRVNVRIEGYGLYMHGFDVEPFITSVDDARKYTFINSLLSTRVYNWAIGASLTMGISLIILIFLSGGNISKKYFYFAMASLFSALFYVDYTVINYLPVSYIVYKKLILLAAMLATYYIHNGILAVIFGDIRKCKSGIVLGYVVLFITFIEMLFGWDMVSFKVLYTYLDLIIPVVFIYDSGILIKSYIDKQGVLRDGTVLLIGMVANSIFVIVDVYQLFRELFTNAYTVLISTYGLIIFILAMNFALIYDYIMVYKKSLKQEQYVSELKDVSLKDSLTGAYNRGYLKEVVSAITGNVCFLMLDIDHFKRINDEFGHGVGDKTLKHVVSVINMQIRSNDILIRYGGEEFLIILVDSDLASGHIVAERIRKAIGDSLIIVRDNEIKITVSIGVCCGVVDDNTTEEMIWSYIQKADEYLYIAKGAGRNKVVAGECPPATT